MFFCRMVNKKGMQMPTLKTQLSQRNNSSVKPCWATQAPANRSTSPAAWLTEVRDYRGWNDNKEKSGMWSQVMGLWVCKDACKWHFPGSEKVKRSVRQPFASKFWRFFAAWSTREECKANAEDTAVAKKQLFSKAVLGHTSPS